jgi:hypothetical protein
VLVDAAATERGWRERISAALVALLEFADQQPGWARFLILEPDEGAPAIADRRRRALAELARVLERETRGRLTVTRRGAPSSSLTAELVVGGIVAVVRSQLVHKATGSFVELAPSLMSFIVGSYQGSERDVAELEHLPVRPTYRTTRVLDAIAFAPRSNNREIADVAGLRDAGQTSKLLSRLEKRGLVENVGLGAGYGEPNEWLLTPAGERTLLAARRLSAPHAGRPRGRQAVGGAI